MDSVVAAWDLDTPLDSIQANTIHIAIQNAKTDIMERLRVTDANAIDEHDVFGLTATGAHAISQVGFVKIYANQAALTAFNISSFPEEGTLHYTENNTTLSVKHGDVFTPITTADHGLLEGLTTLADHPQYLATNGTRSMSGNLTLVDDSLIYVTTIGDDADSPLSSNHVDLQWYEAHGVDAISTDHYTDSCITDINVTPTHGNLYNYTEGYITEYTFVPGLSGYSFGTTMILKKLASGFTQWPVASVPPPAPIFINLRRIEPTSIIAGA
jgi:hypothetical protein